MYQIFNNLNTTKISEIEDLIDEINKSHINRIKDEEI